MSVYKYAFHHHHACVCVCVCVKNDRRITDPGKSIDRDKRISLLEGQKWRDEMNEERE